MKATLRELADLAGGTVVGDPQRIITAAEPCHLAGKDAITFLENVKSKDQFDGSRAGAAVVPLSFTDEKGARPVIQVENVVAAFTKIAAFFRPPRSKMIAGISSKASINPSAVLGEGTSVADGVYIGADVRIGKNCTIYPNAVILDGTSIGDHTVLFPGVTVYEDCRIGSGCILHAGAVIGAYGFGYSCVDGVHRLSAQLGNVEIGDNVEIGANTTIDRGTYGSTRIGAGTKIDNLVMVAHNCSLGRCNLICAHTGIAGSSVTGDYVVMAGRVGVRDHIKVGDNAMIGAMAGVMLDVPENARIVGIPATPEKEQMKKQVALAKLPEMRREFQKLQKETAALAQEVAALRARLGKDENAN